MDANTDGATQSATAPSTLVSDDQSKLLGLPVEIVARITSFLSSETLISVRLTCKALESITFDRFAAENFTDMYCWISTVDDFKLLKNILHQSPRLSNRIRQLTLTTDGFRGLPRSAINYARRRESESEESARVDAIEYLHAVEHLSYADVMIILRTLQDIQRLPQAVSVTADLTTEAALIVNLYGAHPRFLTFQYLPQQCVLFALARSHLQLHSLRIDRDTLLKSDDLRVVSGAELPAIMATLQTLDVESDVSREDMRVYVDFIESASQLRHLGFNTEKDQSSSAERTCLILLPSELLLANRLSCLTSLKITRAILDGESLIEVFRRCQNTLTHMILRYVALTTNDDDLIPVHRAMLAMTKLEFLELQWRSAGTEPYVFFDIPPGGVVPEDRVRVGVERIKQWLHEILDN